jgi:protein SCO1
MKKPTNVSPVHAIVALIVLAIVTTLALYFLEPKSNQDPFAKSEELRMLIETFPKDVQKKINKEIGVLEDRFDRLPYDRIEALVTILQEEPAKVQALTGETRDRRVEKILAQIDTRDTIPPELRGVGITERSGSKLPLHLAFKDHTGQKVTLSDFFRTGQPVILTLNYSDCPQLCHVQLNKFVEIMKENGILPGQGFQIVTVSINPDEAPAKARNARFNYLRELEAPDASWYFLTSQQEETIKELAKAVGFNYKFDPIRKDYAHSSALILCTAKGVVSNYYQGAEYKPDELRTRIAAAAAGKQYVISDAENYFNCKVIDGTRPYAARAVRVLKIVAAVGAVLLALTLAILWMIPSKKPEVLPPLQGDKHA